MDPRETLPEASRYEVLVKVAAGGMGTVYVGRSRGAFGRVFAIKRAHPHLRDDPAFRRMFVEEAQLASRIHHPNVVAVQDVEELDHELLLVMDYVEGAALSELRDVELDPRVRARVATRVVLDAAAGLAATHALRGDDGQRLELVHRDVSPHNVLVGIDGVARLTDFGIAKSASPSAAGTESGALRGKLAYMAPEYIASGRLDQRGDVFALGVVLWEALTGERLFAATTEVELMHIVLACDVAPPGGAASPLDEIVLRALARSPEERFASAAAFADALERTARQFDLVATPAEVGVVVVAHARDVLAARRHAMHERDAVPSGPTEVYVPWEPGQTRTLDPIVRTRPAAARETVAAASPRRSLFGVGVATMLCVAAAVVIFWLRTTQRPQTPIVVTEGIVATADPVRSVALVAPPLPAVTSALVPVDPPPRTAETLPGSDPPPRPRPKPRAADVPGRAPPNPYKR